MKYILGFIGVLVGQFVASLFTGSTPIQWGAGFLCGAFGYWLTAFIRYTRSTPQELLKFHGPDSPITRTQSENELRAFMSQLLDGGLLISFDPSTVNAVVDREQWDCLTPRERLTFAQIILQGCQLRVASADTVSLCDSKNRSIAHYSKASGLITTSS